MSKNDLFKMKATQITKDNTFGNFQNKILGMCLVPGVPITIEIINQYHSLEADVRYYVAGKPIHGQLKILKDIKCFPWYKRIWYKLFDIKRFDYVPNISKEYDICHYYGKKIKEIIRNTPFEFDRIVLRGVYSKSDIFFYSSNWEENGNLRLSTVPEFHNLSKFFQLETFPELFHRKFRSHNDLMKHMDKLFANKVYPKKSNMENGTVIPGIVLKSTVENMVFVQNNEFNQ